VQKPLMCGPSGWLTDQTPWPAGPTLQPLMSFLGGDALQEVVEWNPRPGVGGATLDGRPTMWLGRPAKT
jgi:hypothetical protein